MKKILLFALILSAANTTAWAGKKKDKKKEPVKLEQIVLQTTNDSLSFASGMAATQGLIPYLQQQLNVDTAYMADFILGFREAVKKQNDPHFRAYAAGYQVASMTDQRILPSARRDFEGSPYSITDSIFHAGFAAALANDTAIFTPLSGYEMVSKRAKEVRDAANAKYKAENEAWLADNKGKDGVVTLPSGLQYKVITMGTGAKPTATDKVKVKYEGKTIDGNVFDSSYKRNPQTSSFRCDQVIKGWTEALTLMPVGSKWELYIPQNLAYGERQAGAIKPYSTLIFTVELDDIEPQETKDKDKTPGEMNKMGLEKNAKGKAPIQMNKMGLRKNAKGKKK